MPITINGSGTVTGITAGGLPDGVITTDDIAAAAITRAKIGYAGAILQVVQTVKTDVFSTSTTNSYVDITGLSASITPNSASSKVIIICHLGAVQTANNSGIRLVRDSTSIFVGDASGSRTQASIADLYNAGELNGLPHTITYVDSPSTTSSVTYKTQIFNYNTGTSYINQGSQDSNNAIYRFRTASSIILMEVAA